MNGFDLAGRPIRVGLGNDKFTPESTANLLQRFQGHGGDQRNFQGSAFSGHGGRGAQAGGAGGAFDRAGGRDNDKGLAVPVHWMTPTLQASTLTTIAEMR